MPTDSQQTHERTAPAIPSFASLRDSRRRSPVDLLVPPAPAEAAPEPEVEPVVPDEPVAAPRPAPRPAEYADLLPAAVRLVRWSLRAALTCLRRPPG